MSGGAHSDVRHVLPGHANGHANGVLLCFGIAFALVLLDASERRRVSRAAVPKERGDDHREVDLPPTTCDRRWGELARPRFLASWRDARSVLPLAAVFRVQPLCILEASLGRLCQAVPRRKSAHSGEKSSIRTGEKQTARGLQSGREISVPQTHGRGGLVLRACPIVRCRTDRDDRNRLGRGNHDLHWNNHRRASSHLRVTGALGPRHRFGECQARRQRRLQGRSRASPAKESRKAAP